VDSVKLDSILLTESSILDPSYEIWEQLHQYYKVTPEWPPISQE